MRDRGCDATLHFRRVLKISCVGGGKGSKGGKGGKGSKGGKGGDRVTLMVPAEENGIQVPALSGHQQARG